MATESLLVKVITAPYRLDFEGGTGGIPNEILRGVDTGIKLLALADYPASIIDGFSTTLPAAGAGPEVLIGGKVFRIPPGDRFVTLKTSWGVTGDSAFHGFMYLATTGDDIQVFDSPSGYSIRTQDPLSHIASASQGSMQMNFDRIRLTSNVIHYLTFIVDGHAAGDASTVDDSRWYIDFEDV